MCRDASKVHATFFELFYETIARLNVMDFLSAVKDILIWNLVILNARNLILTMQNYLLK